MNDDILDTWGDAFDRDAYDTSGPGEAQPPPTPTNEPPVWPIVIDRVDSWPLPPSSRERLKAAMSARDAFGRAKYGTPLQVSNHRDHLQDQLDEFLDGAVYAMTEAIRAQNESRFPAVSRNLERCRMAAMLADDVLSEMAARGPK
jgi:hypothetical protein